ncbi:response regulator transcription factor [Actinoplanes sp. NPDC051470]|uniref:response regulator transcription factor n=1 Tax=Actinoplanes sp. NPDC051470 TaxID=3157224 RepID=UPI00342DE2BD
MCAYVLIAEDDPRQAEVLQWYLDAEGYDTAVALDGRVALARARDHEPDLLILDVMMPHLDGLTVCRTLRRESDVMVLMLTARAGEDDLLLGLDVGADDYLTKPYSPRELVARVRTLLRRRAQIAAAGTLHRIGRLVVDLGQHRATADGAAIDCTPAEFAILAAMAAHPGQVFSRAQLMEHTRGFDRESNARTIDMHVMNLRRKIEANPRRPAHLLTVYGVGYRLTDGT